MHNYYHLVLVLPQSCSSSFYIFGGALAPLRSLESNYTKSMIRADLHPSALNPPICLLEKGKVSQSGLPHCSQAKYRETTAKSL